MRERDRLLEAALPGCWSRAVPLGAHFSRLLPGPSRLSPPSCEVLQTGLQRAPRSLAGSTVQGGGDMAIWRVPHPSHKFSHSIQAVEPGCTLQGQSPELFSLNKTTLSLAWKECLGHIFFFPL